MRGAEGDEHGVLAVDRVAHHAAVEDVAGDHADAAGEVAELLGGADQRGHGVTALQRAPGQQPSGAAGRSYDEYVHARIVPAGPRARVARGGGGCAARTAAAADLPGSMKS